MKHGVSRRSAIKAAGTLLGTALIQNAGRAQTPDGDALQRWIGQNAVRIDAGRDKDWSTGNVERLLAAIRGARIVMLGEPSHGAGTAFAAKVRMVQLLHQRLGFDVLAWESGLIDLERTEAALRGDLDPVEAAQRGIFRIWSASAECRPLFTYAKASRSDARPLTMAGFDMQLTAPGTLDYFTAELRAFVDMLDPAKRDQARVLADRMLDHFQLLYRFIDARATKADDALRPTAKDVGGLEETSGELERLLRADESAARIIKGRTGFMMRAIASIAGFGANLFEAYGKHSTEDAARYTVTGENRRDRINADNLRWLIDTAYAGRKIIVWAHNAHVMNAWYGPGFDNVSLQPMADAMKPTGIWLADWYGDDLYTIGFTAWEGRDGVIGAPPATVLPAPHGSLEERLHRLGAPELFLPLRGVPAGSVSMRIPKYEVETVTNPAQAFDALYFIDTMEPATLI